MNTYAEALAVLLLFFAAHLAVGAALMARAGRRPLLWVVFEQASLEVARRLNRETRSAQDRLVRGFIVVVLLLFFALLFGYGINRLSLLPHGWIAELLLLSLTVTAMAPLAVLGRVRRYMAAEKPMRALQTVQGHLTEDISAADRHGVIRKALEYSVVTLNGGLVGPVLYFIALGAPGLMFYLAVMAMHSAFGRADAATVYFGGTVRALEAVVNWIPARVTAFLLALASCLVARAHPAAALRIGWSQADHCESRNRGWVLGAAAGALGVTLGGPRRWLNGAASREDWLGAQEASAKLDEAALRRGAMLCFTVFLSLAAACAFILAGILNFS